MPLFASRSKRWQGFPLRQWSNSDPNYSFYGHHWADSTLNLFSLFYSILPFIHGVEGDKNNLREVILYYSQSFPCSLSGKESVCSAEDMGSVPWSRRAPGKGNGNPLQYSCLENPMDRGAWQATVHGVERVGHDLETKPLSPPFFITPQTISYLNISHTYYAKWTCKNESVQSLSHLQLFATPWTAAHQVSLSITNSWSLLKLMSIKSAMPSDHLILCHPLLLLPSIFPSIRVFSKESVLHIRWPKYWSFRFSISPSNEYPGLISLRIDWFDLLAVQGTLKSFLQHHSSKASIFQCSAFFVVQLSHPYMTTGKTIALTRRIFVCNVSAF